jgi:hypothetical protein
MMTRELARAESGLRLHLENNPEDWDSRLFLADVLEDTGDFILAAGQRWQSRHQRRPFFRPGDEKPFVWFNHYYLHSTKDDPLSGIPHIVFLNLHARYPLFSMVSFASFLLAESELALALDATHPVWLSPAWR